MHANEDDATKLGEANSGYKDHVSAV